MKLATLLIGLAGLGFALYLIASEGPELIFKTFAAAGWGVVIVSALHLPHMALAGYGWQVLWPPKRRPPLTLFMWVLWVREAVNALLPVARIGGEVVALSLLRRAGFPLSTSVGSLVAETTLSVGTTFLFVLMGLGLLAWRAPEYANFLQWLLGLGLFALMIAALAALQRFGAFRLFAKLIDWMARGQLAHLHVSGKKLDRAVHAFYGHPVRLAQCAFWSYVAWFVGSVEITAALHFLGAEFRLEDGIILEAMILAIGSAAFFVPASLGVQEGTFLVFGRLLGLADEVCLALALIRRARDLLVMAPGLIAWQVVEGKKLLGAKGLRG
jgi:putative membrane protein